MNKTSLIRLFSLLLVIVMMSGVLIGCNKQPSGSLPEGGSVTETTPEAEEPKTEEENTAMNEKERLYAEALELIERREDEAAYKLFRKLGDYADSEQYLSRFRYVEVKVEGRYEYEDESENISFATYRILNDKGLLYRIVKCSDEGHDYDEYIYDDHGNLIREETVYDNGDKAVYEYVYDVNNNLVKEICRYSNGDVMIYDYILDGQGRKIKEIRTRSEENSSVILYTYDEKGNLTKSVREDSDGSGYTEDYTYDERGNLLECITTYSEGDSESYVCTYDANNNLLTETFLDEWGEAVYNYRYDDNGNLVEQTYQDDNDNSSVRNYTYDEKGNLIKIVEVDGDEDTTTYEYTHDDEGNVINEIYTSSWGYKQICKSTYQVVYTPYDLSGWALIYNE